MPSKPGSSHVKATLVTSTWFILGVNGAGGRPSICEANNLLTCAFVFHLVQHKSLDMVLHHSHRQSHNLEAPVAVPPNVAPCAKIRCFTSGSWFVFIAKNGCAVPFGSDKFIKVRRSSSVDRFDKRLGEIRVPLAI